MTESASISERTTSEGHLIANRLASKVMAYLLLVLAIAGVFLVLYNTRLGPYLSDDSYYYLSPARDILAGKPYNPSYVFAPMLSLVLSGISLIGIDPLVSVRWLNALLFGVNIFLTGHVARRAGASQVYSLLAASLVLLSDVITETHGWAMSEALAITFMLLSLYFTLRYLSVHQRRYWWLAAVMASLTVLTRYAAIPLIAALALTLLLFSPARRWMHHLIEAALFGLVSLVPIAAYWLRNQLVSGHPVRYEHFLTVPFTRAQVIWFFYNWLSLFVPGRFLRGKEILAGVLFTLISLIIIVGIWWVYRERWRARPNQPFGAGVFLFASVIGLELLMLYLARGLTELDVFNPRYLVPLLLIFLILLTLLAGRLWQVAGNVMRAALVVLVAVFLVYYAYRSVDFSRQVAEKGLGYSNAGWHNSETVAYISSHPEATTGMVGTGNIGIYFWTRHMPVDPASFTDVQALKDYLCRNHTVFFAMNQMPTEIYGLDHDAVAKELRLVQTFNDSEMYECPNP